MSVKVLSCKFEGVDVYHKVPNKKGVYFHCTCTHLRGELLWDSVPYSFDFHRKAGYTGDFGSTPRLIQSRLPSYSEVDDVYNAAYDAHDWLYSVKGEITCPMVSWERSECDDFMRGCLRESSTIRNKGPFARFWSSAADFAVGLFAGGKSHWGNDTYMSQNNAELRLERLNKVALAP